MSERHINLLSVPVILGGGDSRGLERAPQAFFDQEIAEKLRYIGAQIASIDTISGVDPLESPIINQRLHHVDDLLPVLHELAAYTQKTLSDGKTLITLGGDHALSIGTVSGASTALNGDIGLIWVDAHPDINNDATTLTGHIHGMGCSFLLGEGDSRLCSIAGNQPKIKPENLLYIGLKDGCIDDGERVMLQKHNPQRVMLHDIMADSLRPVFDAIEALAQRVSHVWVSFDLDSVDQEYAPGVAMPNPAGLTRREALSIMQHIGKHCPVIGMEMVECHPGKDVDGKTINLAIESVAKLLGLHYDSYTEFMRRHALEAVVA